MGFFYVILQVWVSCDVVRLGDYILALWLLTRERRQSRG